MKTLLDNGEKIEPEICAKIEQELVKYGDQFLTDKGKIRQQEGGDMCSKHYVRNWWGNTQIKQLIEEKLNHQFAMEYEQLSKWHHWNPVGLSSDALAWEGSDITYLTPSPVSSALSLEIGFQCLLHNALVVDNCLALGFDSELGKLNQNYLQEISKEASA